MKGPLLTLEVHDALRAATAGLLQWLKQDYGLDASQAAQVLGSSVR